MTEQEAIKLLYELGKVNCKIEIAMNEDTTSDILNYLCSLNLEYEFVSDFINNRFDFADMSGKRIRGYQRKIIIDEDGLCSYDYVFGYKNYIDDFNNTWTVYLPTEEEIILQEQLKKELLKLLKKENK